MPSLSTSATTATANIKASNAQKHKHSTIADSRLRTRAGTDGKSKTRLPKPKKRMRVAEYHSSSEDSAEEQDAEDDFDMASDASLSPSAASHASSENNGVKIPAKPSKADISTAQTNSEASAPADADSATSSASEEDSDEDHSDRESSLEDNDDQHSADGAPKLKRRNNPDAFSSSLARILNAPLTTTQRANPVLARSAAAATAHKEIADYKLEGKAKTLLRQRRRERELREGGRDKDVLGTGAGADVASLGEEDGARAAEVAALERRLKKTAQRGVITLFNAVRAAQMRGLEAEQLSRAEGLVGIEKRKERVDEMSRSGFLEMLVGSKGGKGADET